MTTGRTAARHDLIHPGWQGDPRLRRIARLAEQPANLDLAGTHLRYDASVVVSPARNTRPDGAAVAMLPPYQDDHRLKVRASVETALGVFLTLPEDSARRLAAAPVDDASWDGVVVPLIEPLTDFACGVG